MSDFTRLCTESSFEVIYGNFTESSASEPSKAQQPKTSYMYVSMDSIFSVSCRKAFPVLYFGETKLDLLHFKVTRFLLV